jgi:LPS-assembly protein
MRQDSSLRSTDTAKDALDAPVSYSAEDSMVLDIPHKKVYLYDQATTDYKDMKLGSGIIQMDQATQTLTALPSPGKDTANQLIQRPHFTQGSTDLTADSMRYNMKSTKGLTYNSFTKSGEMFINSEKSKKIDNNTFFAYNARFTTCDLDTPHFAFHARHIKYISGKFAVTGYTTPEFEGIPFPIGLPYGIFPLVDGQHSGLLPPSFTTNDQYGIGLQGLGFYKVISPNFDFLLKGNIYSYGSWEIDLDPDYYVRYHYKGSVGLSIVNTQIAFKGDPDYTKSTNFNLQWSHSADSKARPGQTFSASMNFMSSKYNQFQTNSPAAVYNNQVQSSVSYTKTWTGTPFYLSSAFSINQNTQQRLDNFSLPNLNFTINTLYPFQKKNEVGTKKWYESLGIGYNGSYQSLISFYDTAFSWKQIRDTIQYGAHHTIPITLTLPSLGPIHISPSVSYDETWFSRQYIVSPWDSLSVGQDGVRGKTDTTIKRGFYTQRQMTYGVSASTAMYGTYNFGSGYIKAIRHVITPTIGFSYQPDLNKGSWYNIRVDSLGDMQSFNKYANGVFGAYSQGTFGGINFGLDNNLEMKVRNNDDTTGNTPYKKVKLIDGFGVTGSYNLVADSFALSDWSIYARSNLFNKINISGSATLDPYQVNSIGQRIQKYVWDGGKFSPGRFVSGNLSASTTFESKKAKDQQADQDQTLQDKDAGNPQALDDDQRELQYVRNNPAEFANFNIPWHLSLSYSLTVNRTQKPDYTGFETLFTQSVNFNGDFNLTPNWKLIGSGTYSIDSHSLQYLQASVARNLHCWQLAINLVPIGYTRSFSITLNPKSGILSDLKINRSRTFYTGPLY